MSGHAVAIATGGKVFCRKQLIRKNVIPIKFTLKSKSITFDIKKSRENIINFKLNKVDISLDKPKHDVVLLKNRKNILYKKS